MSIERQLFERKFPVPENVEWHGDKYRIRPDFIGTATALAAYQGQWDAWQAAVGGAAVKVATIGAKNLNSALQTVDALRVRLEEMTAERDAEKHMKGVAREQRNEMAARVKRLEEALKFYADGNHYSTDDGMSWDSCSGEPHNFLWHESEAWFIEDGLVAKDALSVSYTDPTKYKWPPEGIVLYMPAGAPFDTRVVVRENGTFTIEQTAPVSAPDYCDIDLENLPKGMCGGVVKVGSKGDKSI